MGSQAQAGDVRLAWDPPAAGANLAGYRIHWGQSSKNYQATKEVGKGVTSVTITNLSAGNTYYFVATAFDSAGNESDYSNEVSTTVPLDNVVVLPVEAVTASSWDNPQVPTNTRDGDLNTRWAALGDGQWIMYDLGTQVQVSQVAIAWYQGTARQSAFTIDVSPDGATWTPVYSGESSGKTLELEPYTFAAVPARYVRLVGYGNTANRWTSITEVKIYGTAPVLVDTDGDGLTDQDELQLYGTDPTLADTDSDGLDDGDEVVLWGSAWLDDADDDGLINLLDPDADNDSFADGFEHNQGFNPADAASRPIQENGVVVLPVEAVTASSWQAPNLPANTYDGKQSTRWSALGDGQWIMYDLGTQMHVSQVAIAWYLGNARQSAFTIEVSPDGATWTPVYSGDSSGKTLELEPYAFAAVPARYVRLVGYGNTINLWTSITEVEIYGPQDSYELPTPEEPTPQVLAVEAVTASSWQAPNLPANTYDGKQSTRWATFGDGQWIMYDLGTQMHVSQVAIAWYLGNARQSAFTIEVSPDGATWAPVYSGESSGKTLELEPYTFAAVPARYVRLVGHGNTVNLWTSMTEVEIYGW
jgi:hypothetical protein